MAEPSLSEIGTLGVPHMENWTFEDMVSDHKIIKFYLSGVARTFYMLSLIGISLFPQGNGKLGPQILKKTKAATRGFSCAP